MSLMRPTAVLVRAADPEADADALASGYALKWYLEKKGIDLSTIKDHWETWAEYPLDQSYCSSDIHWYLFDESVNSKYDLIIIAVSS